MRVTLASIILLLVVAISGGCERKAVNPATSRPADAGEISVRLGGSIDEITGVDVPARLKTESFDYLHVHEPADLCVSYPPAGVVELRTRMTSIAIRRGVVSSIDLLPLTESRPFGEVLEQMHRYMAAMNITPDDRMKEQLAKWPPPETGDVIGYTYRCRAVMSLGNDVAFDAEVRSVERGWILVLTFAMEGETALRIAGIKPAPATAPGRR